MLSGRRFDIVRRGRGLIAAVVLAGVLGVPSSAAASDFSWTGASASQNWSDGTNWGGTAPSGSVGMLSFQALSACTTCYVSNNDLSGLSANAISIDDGVPYQITGNPLTLGAGGMTAAATSAIASATIALPIILGAPQTWSIATGAGQLDVGAVTGSTEALTVNVSSGKLALTSDVEVGAVTLTGAGAVGLFGSLNGTNSHPVTVKSPATLLASGAGAKSGSLTSTGGSIQVGAGSSPDGTLAVTGAITLDSSSSLSMFIDQLGTTPSTDYSQVTATGPVNLGGASLFLDGPMTGCPALRVGDKYTLVSTPGSLTGTFSNAANGTTHTLNCSGGTGTAPTVRIDYTADSVTATVLTSAAGGTTTALSTMPSSAVTNQTVTLTATVGPTSPTPAGGTSRFTTTALRFRPARPSRSARRSPRPARRRSRRPPRPTR